MEDENVSRYKNRPKNPRRKDQMAPEHENVFGLQEPIPMVRVLAQRPSGDDYAYLF